MLVYARAKLRLPEDGAEALKLVGVFINYFNLFVYYSYQQMHKH
jgi:hypothetical protein